MTNRKDFLLSLAGSAAALALPGCKSRRRKDSGTKVLMIGNSFSISCMRHLPKVAADLGVDLDLASLYIGGCSLRRHWQNVLKDDDSSFTPYVFDRNAYGTVTKKRLNVCDALYLADWDIVTIQQASHESWRPETYSPFGDNLVAKIREFLPKAKVMVQETWSYTPWDKRLAKWGMTPDEMYARLHDAYGAFAKRHGLGVIPFGTAVQKWRSKLPVRYGERSFGGDVVGGRGQKAEDAFKRTASNRWEPNCDVFHLNEKGEFFQALVWAVTLFGVDLADYDYHPDFVTAAEAKLMKEIAS